MLEEFYALPIFGVGITLLFYALALRLHRKWRWAHPLLLTMAALLVLIVSAKIPVASYRAGGDLLSLLLGPATVALAVPLYKRLGEVRRHARAVLGSIAIGGTVAVASSWATVAAFGGSREVLLPMLSRSVTAPISIGIAQQLGARPELAAMFTVLSGTLGAIIGPALLRFVGIRNDLALGLAIGTSSHGIGTSSVIRRSEAQGAAAGLAMALNGIFTSLLMIPLYPLFSAKPHP